MLLLLLLLVLLRLLLFVRLNAGTETHSATIQAF
jgi:hypothetical protein